MQFVGAERVKGPYVILEQSFPAKKPTSVENSAKAGVAMNVTIKASAKAVRDCMLAIMLKGGY